MAQHLPGSLRRAEFREPARGPPVAAAAVTNKGIALNFNVMCAVHVQIHHTAAVHHRHFLSTCTLYHYVLFMIMTSAGHSSDATHAEAY
jgi:hypothetical protein